MARQAGNREPFHKGERRELRVEGQTITAEHLRAARAEWGEHRYFTLAELSARVQLNHGDPAGDEARLRDIAEHLLTPAEPSPKA